MLDAFGGSNLRGPICSDCSKETGWRIAAYEKKSGSTSRMIEILKSKRERRESAYGRKTVRGKEKVRDQRQTKRSLF